MQGRPWSRRSPTCEINVTSGIADASRSSVMSCGLLHKCCVVQTVACRAVAVLCMRKVLLVCGRHHTARKHSHAAGCCS